MRRRSHEVPHVSAVESGSPWWCWSHDANTPFLAQQVLHLGESSSSLAGQKSVRDVRGTEPLQQPGVVQSPTAQSSVDGGGEAENLNRVERLLEHTYG